MGESLLVSGEGEAVIERGVGESRKNYHCSVGHGNTGVPSISSFLFPKALCKGRSQGF